VLLTEDPARCRDPIESSDDGSQRLGLGRAAPLEFPADHISVARGGQARPVDQAHGGIANRHLSGVDHQSAGW
jgi:hypothetical protein